MDWQYILIIVLISITGFYAFQTKRQADTLARQMKVMIDQRRKAIEPFLQVCNVDLIRSHFNVQNYGSILHPSASIDLSNIGTGPAINLSISATTKVEIIHKKNQTISHHYINFRMRKRLRDSFLEHRLEPVSIELYPTLSRFADLEADYGLIKIRIEYFDTDGMPFSQIKEFPITEVATKWEVEENELLPFDGNYPKHLLA